MTKTGHLQFIGLCIFAQKIVFEGIITSKDVLIRNDNKEMQIDTWKETD